MMIWIVIIVTAICSLFSFYMALLALRNDDNGVFLFMALGLFFGVLFIFSLLQVASGRWSFLKRINGKISGEPKPVSFVPHWFMTAAIIITVICVLAAIFIPIFIR
jgi:magnesium-transporting ATPase (P-type)